MAALGSSLLCAGFCWLLLARVHGVAKGRAWLSDWHFHFFTFQLPWVGLPFSDVCWLLITVASLVAEHRFWVHGLSCSVGSSWIRDQTHVSCIGRWILYHWAIREALKSSFKKTSQLFGVRTSSFVGLWRVAMNKTPCRSGTRVGGLRTAFYGAWWILCPLCLLRGALALNT